MDALGQTKRLITNITVMLTGVNLKRQRRRAQSSRDMHRQHAHTLYPLNLFRNVYTTLFCAERARDPMPRACSAGRRPI